MVTGQFINVHLCIIEPVFKFRGSFIKTFMYNFWVRINITVIHYTLSFFTFFNVKLKFEYFSFIYHAQSEKTL